MKPSCTSQVFRFTDWRNEWKPWSETIRIGVVGIDARDDFADELVALSVDPLDRVAELRGERLVVHRVGRIDQPPHHVLDAIGRLDDADEQVPLLRVDPLQDHLRAVVERAVEILHERLLVDAVFVQRPGRLGPAERPVRSRAVRRCRPANEAGDDIGAGGLSGRQFTGETYSCSSGPARIRYSCAMPCTRTSMLMLKSRLIHLLHWPSARWIVLSPRSIVADLAGAVPVDRERHADVLARLELGDLHLVGLGPRRLRARGAQLLPHDRIRRADQLGLRDVAVEHEPLQDAAELGVAFFVAAQIGAEVVERPHRAANVRQRQAREQSRRSARLPEDR